LAGGIVIALFGLFLSVPALTMLSSGAPHASADLPLPVGILLMSAIPFVGGIALAFKAARTRLLIFGNGFVLRDWRGRERFVPWEALRTLQLQSGVGGGTGTLVAWVDAEDGEQRPEKLTIATGAGSVNTDDEGEDEIATDLAKRANLEAKPRGWLSWGGQVWRRKDDDGTQ
jgi:hypothetical protein